MASQLRTKTLNPLYGDTDLGVMKPHVDDIFESHPDVGIFIRNVQYHPIS